MFVSESLDGPVFTIFFKRAEKKNALNSSFLEELLRSLLSSEERGAKITVLRGSKDAFSSGGDIKEFYQAPDPSLRIDHMAKLLNEVIKKIRYLPSIVIAVVEGIALGAGMSLALACDLVVASEKARFNMGYRRISLTPDGGASLFIPRICGDKRFNALYLFSRDIDAEEAERIGLVNFVFRDEEMEERLNEIISELLLLPFDVIPYFKDLVNSSIFPFLETQLQKERRFVSELAGKEIFRKRIEELLGRKKDA